jgi:GntR family transcriptional regulator
MVVGDLSYFDAQVSVRAGMPLRVAVYNRIADGIRSGKIPLGAALPSESDLARLLGVSRTVAREALMLLEEDGLVRNRRGIGRFATTELPRIGLERIQPIEQFLSSITPDVRLVRTKMEIELASVWLVQGLGLRDGDNSWIWESVLRDGDRPIGITQEHIAVGSQLATVDERLAEFVESVPSDGRSLLRVIQEAVPGPLGPASCQISVSRLGSTRAAILEMNRNDPALVITQNIRHRGKALYLGKHVLVSAAAQIVVMQT